MLLAASLALIGLHERSYGQEAAYFEDNCAGCHTIGGGDGIGPDLINLPGSKSVEWFLAFTHNPDSAIEAGDPYVTKLYQQYNELIMPPFSDLSHDMGVRLYEYIRRQSSDSARGPDHEQAPAEATPDTETVHSPIAAYFEENCASCHTIGGGPGVGPDLQHVTARKDFAWLYAFVTNPDSVAESGDPYAAKMLKQFDDNVMPAFPDLDHPSAKNLFAYIERQSQASGQTPAERPTGEPAVEADPAAGEALFVGKREFDSGAPACWSCHAGGISPVGGSLGPDLTLVFARLGGRKGLRAWLASPPTPVMRSIYRAHPLSRDEVRLLIDAFEEWQAKGEAKASKSSPIASAAVFGGAGGLILILLLMGVVWSNRFRSVRRELIRKATGRK